jgi:cytochrome c oxidase subunit 3
VTSASAATKIPAHGGISRPNMVSVGTIVWLSSELMFFAALFAMYFTTKAVQGAGHWPPTSAQDAHGHPVHLNVWFAGIFTVILILSSVTCQFGVFAAERGDVVALRRWFLLSFFMGAIFIAGQSFEYFVENTFAINSHPYGSVYYLTTGFHGLHVTGGLFAFLFVLARTSYGRFTPDQATYSIVVSYYWHFVDIVWVGLFATIYLLK